MNTVGPTMRMNTNSAIPMAVLAWLRNLMPLLTPVTADIVNTAVTAAMIRTCVTLLTGTPNNVPRPLLICSVPRPSDVVVPNNVANTASTSMILPMGPLTRSPSSGSNIWLTSVLRPLR